MKNIKTALITLCIILVSIASVSGKSVKPIKSNSNKEIELNLSQFGKYLEDGNAQSIEGVYKTEDNRYLIAVIKNKEKTHDYIGVVVSADNEFWKKGEVKFNFVIGENGELSGLYYDSVGEEHEMMFNLGENGIVSEMLEKMQIEELRSNDLALH
jgi:hypothetical protein